MNNFLAFLLGVAGSLTAAALWMVIGDHLLHSLSSGCFNLSGVWLAVFEPISPRPSTSLELVTMLHSRDTVRFRIENHNSVRGPMVRLRGLGKYRSSQLSAVYYLVGKSGQDSGTLVLRSRSTDTGSTVLTGVYTQVADREETGNVSLRSEPYTLQRIDLPFRRRLRRLRKGCYFENYAELRAWLISTGHWEREAPTKGSRATSGSAPSAAPEAPEP